MNDVGFARVTPYAHADRALGKRALYAHRIEDVGALHFARRAGGARRDRKTRKIERHQQGRGRSAVETDQCRIRQARRFTPEYHRVGKTANEIGFEHIPQGYESSRSVVELDGSETRRRAEG